MTKLYCLLQLWLLFALSKPIVCSNDRIFSRKHISSDIPTTRNTSEYVRPDVENSTAHQHSEKAQDHRPEQPAAESPPKDTKVVNDTIYSIFQLGPEKGLTLFSSKLEPHVTPIHNMQADQSFIDKSSNNEQAFKVQRTPDGKLNLVFNDFLFSQSPAPSETRLKVKLPDFVFPDEYHNLNNKHPKCEDDVSAGKTYCTKVRNYPDLKHLDPTLKNELSRFEAFFGEDLTLPQNITQRMNYEPDEEYLCNSVERIVYPESAETISSGWWPILNREDYRQGVRIEECINTDEPCKYESSLPNHYRATCKQSYHYRLLVTIKNGSVTTDHFKMPSCCKCVLKQVRN